MSVPLFMEKISRYRDKELFRLKQNLSRQQADNYCWVCNNTIKKLYLLWANVKTAPDAIILRLQ